MGKTVGTTLGRTPHTARSLVDESCATQPSLSLVDRCGLNRPRCCGRWHEWPAVHNTVSAVLWTRRRSLGGWSGPSWSDMTRVGSTCILSIGPTPSPGSRRAGPVMARWCSPWRRCGPGLLTTTPRSAPQTGDPARVGEAAQKFTKARTVTSATGVVAEVARLFAVLATSDDVGLLKEYREALEGVQGQ